MPCEVVYATAATDTATVVTVAATNDYTLAAPDETRLLRSIWFGYMGKS